MSWHTICLSIVKISEINLGPKIRCLLILDDRDGTYVLIAGESSYQWFFVLPGLLQKIEMGLCDVRGKSVSNNSAFIGELSKVIRVPTASMQNEILMSC